MATGFRSRGPLGSSLRVAGGVGGIAEASTAPPASAGGIGGGWFSPSEPHFWTAVFSVGSVLWLVWIRWIYRGAAL